MTTLSTDVLVMGAGPAGCAAGMTLRAAGHRVIVIDRYHRAQERLGEILPSIAFSDVQQLGLAAVFDALGLPRIEAVRVEWRRTSGRPWQALKGWSLFGNSFGQALWRGVLDHGAELRSGVSVSRVSQARDGVVAMCRSQGKSFCVRSLYAIDARGCAGSRSCDREPLGGESLLASGAVSNAHDRAHNERATALVRALPGAWMFFIAEERGSRGAVVIHRMRDAARGQYQDAMCELLRATEAPDAAADVRRFTRLVHMSRARAIAGCRVVAVGDAAVAVDPLLGTGISFALRSGREAGLLVAAALGGGRSVDSSEYESGVLGYARSCVDARSVLYASVAPGVAF